jgi:hypothetical protein
VYGQPHPDAFDLYGGLEGRMCQESFNRLGLTATGRSRGVLRDELR